MIRQRTTLEQQINENLADGLEPVAQPEDSSIPDKTGIDAGPSEKKRRRANASRDSHTLLGKQKAAEPVVTS